MSKTAGGLRLPALSAPIWSQHYLWMWIPGLRAGLAEVTRDKRNTPGGYWCIEPGRADAAANMLYGTIRTNRPVVVSSPGALRAGVDGLYRRAVRKRAEVATNWAWRHSEGMQDCTIALLD